MNNEIVNNFALAILDIYIETKKINKLEEETNALITILNQNPKLPMILNSSKIKKSERKELIDKWFKASFSKKLINAMKLMIDKSIIIYIKQIFLELIILINKFNHLKTAIVYSVIKLKKIQMEKLKIKLQKVIPGKIKMINKIDKSLIGGIKIVVEDLVYDYSIASKLAILKEHKL